MPGGKRNTRWQKATNNMRTLLSTVLLAATLTMLGCGGAANVSTANTAKKIEKESDVPRISVADAKKEFDGGNTVIVDSRGEGAYQAEHIAGAINIPFGSKDDAFSTLTKGKR